MGEAHKRVRQRGIVALDLFIVIAALGSCLRAGCLRRGLHGTPNTGGAWESEALGRASPKCRTDVLQEGPVAKLPVKQVTRSGSKRGGGSGEPF